MCRWSLARYFAGIVGSVVVAGCGGGAPSGVTMLGAQSHAAHRAPANARMIALTNSLGAVPVQHLNRGKSWIRSNAGKEWLLYVSDASSGAVDIYNYRSKAGKLYGQITGLSFPYGQCIDGAGDVYVVDNATAQIYEYAHGGTTPIATASDTYGDPIGCSVDPTTGNVAVANFDGLASDAGGIDIFAGGLSGSQTNYPNSNLYHLWPPGYDPSGNLFVQGTDYSGAISLAELPARKKKFTFLTGLTIDFPGSVAWDGSYIAVTDQNYQYNYTTMIYRITVSGSKVTIVRATDLTDTCYPYRNWMVAVQPFVGAMGKRNTVVAGNLQCPNRVGFWNYTKGGAPKRVLPPGIAPGVPYGQSVSPPSHRNTPITF
jgi:hypothetical protein